MLLGPIQSEQQAEDGGQNDYQQLLGHSRGLVCTELTGKNGMGAVADRVPGSTGVQVRVTRFPGDAEDGASTGCISSLSHRRPAVIYILSSLSHRTCYIDKTGTIIIDLRTP